MRTIPNTDLLINPNGSIYHLNLLPDQIADTIIIVGDPDRVTEVSCHFDSIEHQVRNREFITHTGTLRGKRISALSTGIGTDNIDIVINELDALVNINLQTRQEYPEKKHLSIIRLGTSGSIQEDIPVDSFSLSVYGMGLDNLMRFYAENHLDKEMEEAFIEQTGWTIPHVRPYFIQGSQRLIDLFSEGTFRGITATAPGFYAPQGRGLRLLPFDQNLIEKLQKFSWKGERIINFEMETSALYGLGGLLGHDVVTVCALIANRAKKTYDSSHKQVIQNLISLVLERITQHG